MIVVDCGLLMDPVFGEVNITDTIFGSVANYSCQRGYNINGTSMRLCEGNGQWTDQMPQCIRKTISSILELLLTVIIIFMLCYM